MPKLAARMQVCRNGLDYSCDICARRASLSSTDDNALMRLESRFFVSLTAGMSAACPKRLTPSSALPSILTLASNSPIFQLFYIVSR